jgi:hypothetical protein
LELEALRKDRAFHTFNTFATGLNADIEVALENTGGRTAVESFLAAGEGFDFEAAHGPVTAAVTGWQKSAGLYSGAGIAADAYRYGVLRDQGYECEDIATARAQLSRDLDALHIASAITGVPGAIARSLARNDLPGDGMRVMVTALFDGSGRPLPEEKTNGTWRADNSGQYPDYVWEDSTSRDMLVGWAMAYGAAWEVVRDDATFATELKTRIQADAGDLLRGLKTVRDQGHDLEIPDADGRTTFHGYINENAFERGYIEGIANGFYAGMAIGITSALAFVSEDAELVKYVEEDLAVTRDLPGIAGRDMLEVNLGVISNFSNYNMAFTAMWLGTRYLANDTGRGKLKVALDRGLYAVRDGDRQPVEMKMSFYDFIFAAGLAESRPGQDALKPFDGDAVARGVETLKQFPRAPYWELAVENCDEAEVMAKLCTAVDGSTIELHDDLGRGEIVIAKRPVPMEIRPASNYHWRSNPYAVNGGGDGSRLLPAVDFRAAYWMGRFISGVAN